MWLDLRKHDGDSTIFQLFLKLCCTNWSPVIQDNVLCSIEEVNEENADKYNLRTRTSPNNSRTNAIEISKHCPIHNQGRHDNQQILWFMEQFPNAENNEKCANNQLETNPNWQCIINKDYPKYRQEQESNINDCGCENQTLCSHLGLTLEYIVGIHAKH